MIREDRVAHREMLLKRVAYAHFLVAGGSATIAGFERDEGFLVYGIALCSPLDQFSRKQGRRLSFFRLTGRDRGTIPSSDLSGVFHESPPSPSLTAKLRSALVHHMHFYTRLVFAPQWLGDVAKKLREMGSNFEQHIAGPNGKPWNREDQGTVGKVHPDALASMKAQGAPTTRWGAYQNMALDSSTCGHLQFLAIGPENTFKEPPKRYPDTQFGLGWKYLFVGWVNLETGDVEENKL
jgi:hypothetical protein